MSEQQPEGDRLHQLYKQTLLCETHRHSHEYDKLTLYYRENKE